VLSDTRYIEKYLTVSGSESIDTWRWEIQGVYAARQLAVSASGRREKHLAVNGSDIIKTHLAVGVSGRMEENFRDDWVRVCKEPSALQIGAQRK
jgi:hypothetical protein